MIFGRIWGKIFLWNLFWKKLGWRKFFGKNRKNGAGQEEKREDFVSGSCGAGLRVSGAAEFGEWKIGGAGAGLVGARRAAGAGVQGSREVFDGGRCGEDGNFQDSFRGNLHRGEEKTDELSDRGKNFVGEVWEIGEKSWRGFQEKLESLGRVLCFLFDCFSGYFYDSAGSADVSLQHGYVSYF